LKLQPQLLERTAQKFLAAVKKAGEVHSIVLKREGRGQLYSRGFDG
jgi:hypothetical protein